MHIRHQKQQTNFRQFNEALQKVLREHAGLKELYLKNEYNTKLEVLTKVIQENPSDIFSYQRRAELYQTNGYFDLAQLDYKKMIDLSKGKFAYPYYQRGMFSFKQKLYIEAYLDFKIALSYENFEYEDEVRLFCGKACEKINKQEEAEEYFLKSFQVALTTQNQAILDKLIFKFCIMNYIQTHSEEYIQIATTYALDIFLSKTLNLIDNEKISACLAKNQILFFTALEKNNLKTLEKFLEAGKITDKNIIEKMIVKAKRVDTNLLDRLLTVPEINSSREPNEKILLQCILSFASNEKLDLAKKLKLMGYSNVLRKIDFEQLSKDYYSTIMYSKNVIINLLNKLSWSNLIIINCKNVPMIEKFALNNTQFIDCHLGGFNNGLLENCHFLNCVFSNVKINKCRLSNVVLNNCEFTECKMVKWQLSHFRMEDCLIQSCYLEKIEVEQYEDTSYYASNNIFDNKCAFSDTPWDEESQEKEADFGWQEIPYIAVVFDKSGGTQFCDKMNVYLESKKFKLLLITPEVGMQHAIFKTTNKLAGIYFPGGPDVSSDDNEIRKKFEIELLDYAVQNKIPTIGICRGHQLIGSRFGGTIKNMSSHTSDTIFVEKMTEENQVYSSLFKLHAKKTKNAQQFDSLKKNAKGSFEYSSYCAHKQAVFFQNDYDKNEVSITAMSEDGIIESMIILNHILTFQHHNEEYANQDSEDAKVARSLLKIFVRWVRAYHTEQNEDYLNRTKHFNLM